MPPDPQIAELKELVRQSIAISTDTNKIVHGMRNAGRLKSIFWFVIFVLSIATSVYSYFYFVAPRIEQIKEVYQKQVVPLQKSGINFLDLIKGMSGQPTSSQ